MVHLSRPVSRLQVQRPATSVSAYCGTGRCFPSSTLGSWLGRTKSTAARQSYRTPVRATSNVATPTASPNGASGAGNGSQATARAPAVTSIPDPTTAAAPASSSVPFTWQRTWVPVSPISYLDPTRPAPLTLLGQPLVVWHHASQGWVVMRDACPHRLAPLSEGRLEAGGTRLACAYHGWEFSETGTCTKVPQLANDARAAATACTSPRSCVMSYPTLVADGLLFVWLDGSPEGRAAAAQAPPPRLLDEEAVGVVDWAMSEIPNDYSFWIEQAFDPSHANFLHHGVGGFREDHYLPMTARVVRDVQAGQGFTFQHGAYEKKQAGMSAERQFLPPYTNRVRYNLPNGKASCFCTLVTPVRPGVCRTFIKFGFGSSTAGAGSQADTLPLSSSQGLQTGTDTAAAAAAASGTSATAPPSEAAPAATATAAGNAGGVSKDAASGDGLAGSGSGSPQSERQQSGGRLGPLPAFALGLLGRVPHWLFGNGILGDQDVVIIYGQELLMRRQGLNRRDYLLNSPADEGVAAAHFWFGLVDYPASLWGGHSSSSSSASTSSSSSQQQPHQQVVSATGFPAHTYTGWPEQELPLERLLSRYDRHVRHCAVCQQGLRQVTVICTALTAAAGLAGATAAGLAAAVVLGPQAAAAGALGAGWGWTAGWAAAAAVLAAAAVKGWGFREERFVSGAKQWRRVGGFPGFKKLVK